MARVAFELLAFSKEGALRLRELYAGDSELAKPLGAIGVIS
jgi:hypothetical protein